MCVGIDMICKEEFKKSSKSDNSIFECNINNCQNCDINVNPTLRTYVIHGLSIGG